MCERKSACDSMSVLVASVLHKKKEKKMEKKIIVCVRERVRAIAPLCMLQSIVVCYFKKNKKNKKNQSVCERKRQVQQHLCVACKAAYDYATVKIQNN